MSAAIGAFSEEQVEKITGVSRRQLQGWARSGFFAPSYASNSRAFGRIYSFRDLVSLKVLNNLRNVSGVPMRELRRTAEVLNAYGEDAWAKTKLWVLQGKVLFAEPETGKLREVTGPQYVAAACVEVEISNALDDVRRLNERTPEVEGRIVRNKYVHRRDFVIAGTRIPVSAIMSFHRAGYAVSEIRSEYPDLTAKDVEAAIAFGSEARAA